MTHISEERSKHIRLTERLLRFVEANNIIKCISSFEAARNPVYRYTTGVGEDYDTNKTDRTEVLVSRRDWTYCDRDWGKKEEMWWRGILARKNKAIAV